MSITSAIGGHLAMSARGCGVLFEVMLVHVLVVRADADTDAWVCTDAGGGAGASARTGGDGGRNGADVCGGGHDWWIWL